jgi:hypothetical protein
MVELVCSCGYSYGMAEGLPRERDRRGRTACLDFDGVLHSYSSGWKGAAEIPDPPNEGALEAVEALRQCFHVAVQSTRCATPAGLQAVKAWLRRHRIPVDEVASEKPPAFVYLDDRGLRFEGDWADAVFNIYRLYTAQKLGR